MGIEVSKSAAIGDTLKAAGRYIGVIITTVPILLTLIGNRNFVGLVNYFMGADGTTFIAAVVGLITLGYGLFRTFKRGNQVVALTEEVPDRIAKFK